MGQSEISEDYSILIPKEVREKFNVEPGDILKWTIEDDIINVSFHKVIYLGDIIARAKNKD